MSRKLKKVDFLKEVREEIEHIKKHATQHELSNLDYSWFNPFYPNKCIYGMMTGHCDSRRANKLYNKKYGSIGDHNSEDKPTQTLKELVGDDSYFNDDEDFFEIDSFTPLEVYVSLKDARKRNVVKYLKNEISELKL